MTTERHTSCPTCGKSEGWNGHAYGPCVTIDRIIVSAPSVWHDDYRVTLVTRHRTGAGVWDGAGDTAHAALTQAALSAGIPTPAPTRVLPSGDTVRAYTAGEWS